MMIPSERWGEKDAASGLIRHSGVLTFVDCDSLCPENEQKDGPARLHGVRLCEGSESLRPNAKAWTPYVVKKYAGDACEKAGDMMRNCEYDRWQSFLSSGAGIANSQ